MAVPIGVNEKWLHEQLDKLTEIEGFEAVGENALDQCREWFQHNRSFLTYRPYTVRHDPTPGTKSGVQVVWNNPACGIELTFDDNGTVSVEIVTAAKHSKSLTAQILAPAVVAGRC